jgi:iron complex outermembrane receptor protein
MFTGVRIMKDTERLFAHTGLALALGVLFFSQPALSASRYMDLTLEQLLQVKVHSVSKKDELISNAPAAVYAITSADIERSGVTTIPDVLRMVPGVQVARSDSNSWAISIRGFNSVLANKLLVLIDGRTVYNPVFGGAFWETHDLLLEDIQRVEVIRGPGGSLWGANAVNGVINIITKHTRDTQGNLVSATYGNEEKGTLSARHGGSFGTTGFYRVYAKGFKRDASIKPPIPNTADTDTYDEWDGFRGGFRIDWDDQFTFQGNAYRTDAQQLRPDHSLIAPYLTLEQQTIVYEGANFIGRWTHQNNDGSQWIIQSYVDWTKRDEPFNFIDERTTFDVDTQYDFASSSRQQISVGAGIRVLSDDKQGNHNVSFTSPDETNIIYSAFIQDKITLAPDAWFLTLGTKIEHNDFSGLEVQPNARLQWRFDQQQNFWASISHAVRTPTPIEQSTTSTFATTENIRLAIVPNTDFKSEELTAYEVGYRNQITPSLSVDIATFYNDYEKLTTTTFDDPYLVNNGVDPLHFLIPIKFTNDMKGRSNGAEIVLGWKVSDSLHIAADYSYLDMSLEAIDPTQETAERLSPRHQLGAKLFWDIEDDWNLGVFASYVDKLPATDVDAYVRLDINLSRQITQSLKLSLVGQDLLDGSHREFANAGDINAGEIERSIFGKLTWQF